MISIGIFMKRMPENHKNYTYRLQIGDIFHKTSVV